MNSVNGFKECMANTVNQTSLNETNWRSDDWKNLWSKVDQEVLRDAFEKHELVRSIFVDIGDIITRNCKSLPRVEKKMTEQQTGRENYFKVVSDFVAVRIHCDVIEIPTKIDHIRNIVLENGGQIYVRGSSNERPYGFVMDADKKFTDITQYLYVFIEKVGYPIEVQIGHEFASHTFKIDSDLRDNPNCGKVDLWSKNFYGDVKNLILAKANINYMLAKAEEIHPNNVPEELQEILNKL